VQPETSLYAPVKALLEAQGYVVKGEVIGCDVVGVRGDEPPLVVELKRTFGLALVLQGIDRLAMTDAVYLAVGAWPTRQAETRRLCRRLGLGLIVVTHGRAEVVTDPEPYQPRKDKRCAAPRSWPRVRCRCARCARPPMCPTPGASSGTTSTAGSSGSIAACTP
jgi:hypothetical protein